MKVRRRELRVRLRSDRVGHGPVMDWLDALERDGRGVAGLQALVIEALADALARGEANPPASAPETQPRLEGAPLRKPPVRPVKRAAHSDDVAIAARRDAAEDVLARAASNLNF